MIGFKPQGGDTAEPICLTESDGDVVAEAEAAMDMVPPRVREMAKITKQSYDLHEPSGP